MLTRTRLLDLQRASWPAAMQRLRCGLARAVEGGFLAELARVAEGFGGMHRPSTVSRDGGGLLWDLFFFLSRFAADLDHAHGATKSPSSHGNLRRRASRGKINPELAPCHQELHYKARQ
jgi:hypothetical protein